MKEVNRKKLGISLGLLAAFVLWTVAVTYIDVRAIGPRGSVVGLSAMNRFVHEHIGVHMSLYAVTDWLGVVPFAFVAGFALVGLMQWIRRKSIRRVDRSILVLGGFYIVVLAVFVFFEVVVINCRPVLIRGCLEPSYPSSSTVLAICVMSTACRQLCARISNRVCRRCAAGLLRAFMVCMVAGRLISGVHWASDIVGGILLSAGLVMLYDSAAEEPRKGRAEKTGLCRMI